MSKGAKNKKERKEKVGQRTKRVGGETFLPLESEDLEVEEMKEVSGSKSGLAGSRET